jgi:predicted glycoside hydrolase/deacetylase ChbG (UPF0249 family)
LKYLIPNADDFGFTRDVNQGIVEAHRRGILTATTIMATGRAFQNAVELARQNPELDIGVHLVLVDSEGFPPTIPQLILSLGRIKIYDQLVRQVQKVLDAGLKPTHLDTHKHTHLLPQVFHAVTRIAREFNIPWVRRRLLLPTYGCRTTDHFAGFRMNIDTATMAHFIRNLPEGATEFMCHPGLCTDELRAARTRLKESRRRELDALTSPEVRAALEESSVKLTRFPDFQTAP